MRRLVPVMKRAGSEHKKATDFPKSAGSPMNPTGTSLAMSAALRVLEARRSVACAPGWAELTVTPSGATSVASTLRKPVTPVRAVTDAIRA